MSLIVLISKLFQRFASLDEKALLFCWIKKIKRDLQLVGETTLAVSESTKHVREATRRQNDSNSKQKSRVWLSKTRLKNYTMTENIRVCWLVESDSRWDEIVNHEKNVVNLFRVFIFSILTILIFSLEFSHALDYVYHRGHIFRIRGVLVIRAHSRLT